MEAGVLENDGEADGVEAAIREAGSRSRESRESIAGVISSSEETWPADWRAELQRERNERNILESEQRAELHQAKLGRKDDYEYWDKKLYCGQLHGRDCILIGTEGLHDQRLMRDCTEELPDELVND